MLARVMALDTSAIRALTFDCYGTLIDWDGGIRAAVRQIEALKGCELERLLRDREECEKELIAGPYRIYSGILGDSLRAAAAKQDRPLAYGDVLGFVNTMPRWPAFPDTGKNLRRLTVSYTLAILSNVETKVLQASVKLIGAPFVALITAEELKSYKPAPKHWEAALKRLHQPPERVLHVAGSLHHDIRPARELGFPTAWINRRNEPVPDDLDPEAVFADIAGLVNALLGPAAKVS
jgi:2-haloalkanoic acid dehalogenase type II